MLTDWLQDLGLEQYAANLRSANVDLDIVKELTDEDLRELGFSLGHRRRFLSAVRKFAEVGEQAERPTSSAERRHLTVMFADLVGSTNISTRIDPEDLLDLISYYHRLCREIVERHGGSIINLTGDGALAFFGYPMAAENDAERGVWAGLEIAQQIAKRSTPDGEPLSARIGLASGLVVVGDLRGREVDGFGDIPNLAARLQSVASPGTVVVSDDTKSLVGHAFECAPLGKLQLKGFDKRMDAWSARARDRSESRFMAQHASQLTPLAGRGTEIKKLRDTWSAVLADMGAVVAITGEAGVGKSRICYEFAHEVGQSASIVTLQGVDGGEATPLLPVVEELHRAAGLTDTASADDNLDRLEKYCAVVGLLNDDVALIADLCGIASAGRYKPIELAPPLLKAAIRETLVRRLVNMAEHRPVLIIAEDVHWFDPSTIDFIGALSDAATTRPICVLLTVRPEQSEAGNIPQSAVRLNLTRLPRAAARLIVNSIAKSSLDPEIVDHILDRAEGVPLFVREFILSLANIGPGEAEQLLTTDAAIPMTLRGALSARLDRLGRGRQVAQEAAIIGREFHRDLVASLTSHSKQTLDAVLERLLDEGVIEAAGDDVDGRSRFRFSHALIHEAAYESQLRRKRRASHLAVAQALENQGETNHQLFGHHLELADKPLAAMQHWRTAALYALTQSHNAEAIALYDRALNLLEPIPATERDTVFEVSVLIEQGFAYIATMGFAAPAVQRVYDRAEKLGRALGPGLDMMRALWGSWLYCLVSGNLKRARALAEEMLELADTSGNDRLRVEALWALGNTEFWMADLASSEQHLNEAIDIYDRLGADSFADHLLLFGQDPKVAALSYLGYLKWTTGHLIESRTASIGSMRHADRLDHPFTSGWAYCFGVNSFWWRKEYWAAIHFGPSVIKYCDEHYFALWSPATQIGYGASLASVASSDAECESSSITATQGLRGYMATGAVAVVPTASFQIADSWMKAGNFKEARYWIDHGQEIAKATGERISVLRSQVYRARLMRATGEPDTKTERLLKKAVKDASASGAAMIALENAMELLKLLDQTGREAEARKILASAVNNMPEPRTHRCVRAAVRMLDEAIT